VLQAKSLQGVSLVLGVSACESTNCVCLCATTLCDILCYLCEQASELGCDGSLMGDGLQSTSLQSTSIYNLQSGYNLHLSTIFTYLQYSIWLPNSLHTVYGLQEYSLHTVYGLQFGNLHPTYNLPFGYSLHYTMSGRVYNLQ
jgi:hypothetical protein